MKADHPHSRDTATAPTHGELRSVAWFATSFPTRAGNGNGTAGIIVRSAIGVAIGLAVLFGLGHAVAGAIIIAVSLTLGVASLASAAMRDGIARFLALLGDWLGMAVSWVLLAPVFLVGFTAVRGWIWLTRSDPLQLRNDARQTQWLQADQRERKLRYASAMFASERITRRGLSLSVVVGLALAALVLSELLLRAWGFGGPVLYVSDPQAGFYPAPNQVIDRYGGRIETNRYGMRTADYPLRKSPGAFRVLMIGDSTLYGGSYIDQQSLYSRQLEGLLREEAGARPVEVLAIGVNAWGPFHKIGYTEKFGTFDADLALVQLPTADIYRSFHGIGEVPFHRVDKPPHLALEEVLGHLAWRYRANISGPESDEERAWHRQRGLNAYARLAALLAADGAEVVFNVLPSRLAGVGPTVPPEEARDVDDLRDAVAPFAVNYPEGIFRGMAGAIYHDQGHLDVDGHRHYAAHLRDEVLGSSQAWVHWLERKPD
jgi:hypothetical protein